ncbi:MAG: enolase C-terminal domain-like protein [Verrucomicrobiales bacterium]
MTSHSHDDSPCPSRIPRRAALRQGAILTAGVSSLCGSARPLRAATKRPELNARILEAEVEFLDRTLDPPLRLSSGVITEVTEARARVTVQVGEKRGIGRGSIYLSNLWSWPDPEIPHARRDAALRELCRRISRDLPGLCGDEPAHPLELGLRLHAALTEEAEALPERSVPIDDPPVLARALCGSPFDAAIHDAAGQALERSAFAFYEEPFSIPSADEAFPDEGACGAVAGLLRKPITRLKSWWVVGAQDDLEAVVAPAVRKRGDRCFKLKIGGEDPAADADRTVEVFRFVRTLGIARPRLIADSNQGTPDADSVAEYLERIRAADPEAFAALLYLEQPTGRDIEKSAYGWTAVTRLKPVFLDEGLIHPRLSPFRLFETARDQGWSGFALKTCKGHSFTLVAAAWAKRHGLEISLQDLTNPGLAAIHAALLAAHVPFVNEVELNSPQFTPGANREWLPRLSGLFEPRGGRHRLDFPIPNGLGSTL